MRGSACSFGISKLLLTWFVELTALVFCSLFKQKKKKPCFVQNANEKHLSHGVNTLYKGLLKRFGDTEKISSLVDAVGSSLRPGSFWQKVKQVAVVVERVKHPRATFFIPACNKKNSFYIHLNTLSGCYHQAWIWEKRSMVWTWSRRWRLRGRSLSFSYRETKNDFKMEPGKQKEGHKGRSMTPFWQIYSLVVVQKSSLSSPASTWFIPLMCAQSSLFCQLSGWLGAQGRKFCDPQKTAAQTEMLSHHTDSDYTSFLHLLQLFHRRTRNGFH